MSSSWWPIMYLSTDGHGLPLPSKRYIRLLRIFYSSIHKKSFFSFKKLIYLSKKKEFDHILSNVAIAHMWLFFGSG